MLGLRQKCKCGQFKALSADCCKKCRMKRVGIQNLSCRNCVEASSSPSETVFLTEPAVVTPEHYSTIEDESRESVVFDVPVTRSCKRRKVGFIDTVTEVTSVGSMESENDSIADIQQRNEEWLFMDDGEAYVDLGTQEDGFEDDYSQAESCEEPSDNSSSCSNDDSQKKTEESPKEVQEGDVPAFIMPPKLPNLKDISHICRNMADVCFNCRRCSSEGFDGIKAYEVILSLLPVGDIRWNLQRWRTVEKEECSSGFAMLCLECVEVLSVSRFNAREKKPCKWKDLWPVYIWNILKSEEACRDFGIEILNYIPVQWWGYWTGALHDLQPEVFPFADPLKYESLVAMKVTDVTLRRGLLLHMKSGLRLGEIMQTCNSLLMPVALCPWGCSCYYYEDGWCSYDAIMKRHLGLIGSIGYICNAAESSRVESSRDDFLSGAVDCHLFNPSWSVYPSVFFCEGVGPVFLTCNEHNGGTSDQYFHLPKTENVLPLRISESLSPGVLRTRTLKATVPMKYSNGYRLQKCQASYCGIDTAYVSEQRNFDYLSHLEDLSEARAFRYRPDIKGLASSLVKDGKMGEEYFQNLRKRSEALFPEPAANDGATLLCLPDAIKLQKFLSSTGVKEIRNADTEKTITFRPNWPPFLLRIQVNSKFGAAFPSVPMMKSITRGSKSSVCYLCLWCLCHCFVCLHVVWESASKHLEHSDDWKGFLLSFLSRTVTKQSSGVSKHRNPFYKPAGDELMTLKGLNKAVFEDSFPRFPLAVIEALNSCFAKSECAAVEITGKDFATLQNGAGTHFHSDCKMFVYHGKANRTDQLPTVVTQGKMTFELRLCCFCESSEIERRPNNWKAQIWYRYGEYFSGWWTTKRDGISSRTYKASKMSFDPELFSFGVYVATERVSLCEYRRSYLKYIGGQNHVLCSRHEIPLITSYVPKSEQGLACCNKNEESICTLKEEYSCPVENCCICLCKQCFKSMSENTVNYVREDQNNNRCDTLPSSEAVIDDSDGSDCCSDDNENDEASNGSSEEEVDFSMLHTGSDVPLFDIEHSVEEADEDQHENVFATSHSGAIADSFSGSLGSMGTSVLLNKFGTVLVRRDNRLQASKREKNLVERVASRVTCGTIPLVYMEAMLFPSIFWCQAGSSSGGILGSIPTSLFCQHATRRRFRIASLADHAKVRLKSCSSIASTSPTYLSFLFDALANGALEGADTRVVLNRGFEESMGPAGMRVRNRDEDLYTDTIDNRQNCHNLCASERDKRNTLFVTLTCNQREHFGISPIKRYVDSDEAFENYVQSRKKQFPKEPRLSVVEEAEVKFAFQEASRTLIVRNWMEVRLLLIRYLIKSPEQPAGAVERIFVRDEYQAEKGNLSHMHMLLTLSEGYDTVQGRQHIQKLIRGFVDEIVGLDEVESFIDQGIFKDWRDYWEMKDQALRILPHSCNSYRCLRRVGPNRDQLKCRVPDTRKLSPDLMNFYTRKIDIEHLSDALKIYEELDLCENRELNGGRFVPKAEFLDPKRILAPARFGEGNITPVIGKLFAATRSSMNVQVCTSFGTSRYLVKYVTSIDENNYVSFGRKQSQENVFNPEGVALHNTKIASSALQEAQKFKRSRHKDRPKGRAIASTEMMQIILGHPQVYTNVEYIKVSTLPMGDRPGLERKSPQEKYQEFLMRQRISGSSVPDLYHFCCPTIQRRIDLFGQRSDRCFTPSQEVVLRDQVHAPVTLDRVTVFSIRPPELLLIDKMEWYFKFFERSTWSVLDEEDDSACFNARVKRDILATQWIDGLGHRVLLRPIALPGLIRLLGTERFQIRNIPKHYRTGLKLLNLICSRYSSTGLTLGPEGLTAKAVDLPKVASLQWKKIQKNCIALECNKSVLPIPVFSNVRPKNATKFVIHLILSMGHFETENDLWSTPSMRHAFVNAGLLNVDNVAMITEESCNQLLKRWILDQAQYYPITARTMDNFACSANSILRSVLLQDEIPIDEIPPCLYTRLHHDINAEILSYKQNVRSCLTTAVLNGLRSAYAHCPESLPSFQSIVNADRSPIPEKVLFPKSNYQSQESYSEQIRVFSMCKNAVQKYSLPDTVSCKNVIIAGPPGAGKTHCLLQSVLYVLCYGLTAITTAMLAERAFLLGGQHFHKLFCLRVRDQGFRVHRLAELAVISLQKNPPAMAFLRTLDVLFIDEMGQLSAELLSVLDIIMRRVRDSSLFMGGILIIGTLDQVQLRPIKQLPFLLSPYVVTSFLLDRLEHYVRCSECKVLQEINQLARFQTTCNLSKENIINRFIDLVSQNCTFVDSWSDLKSVSNVLRIFPRRRQAAEATAEFLSKKREESISFNKSFLVAKAIDTMVPLESHGEWIQATDSVRSLLDKKASEPNKIAFFEGAVYQFTYNCGKRFSNTQLCILLEVPTEETVKDYKPVTVLAAPAGSKVTDISQNKNDLIKQGWKEVQVGVAPEYSQTFWDQGVKAKRKQYGLRHHVASTVHSAIGHTMVKVATELSLKNGVWERAMIVVLISRVKFAKDIIFVGGKRQNLDALREGLLIRCQYDEYMDHLVDVMSGMARGTKFQPVELNHHPYRSKDIPLPLDSSGVVYLLCSTKNHRALYVGYTQNLRNRLNQHNSGYGSKGSSDPALRPWALAAYVCGFEGDRKLMNKFEVAWQQKHVYMRPRSVTDAISIGQSLIENHYADHKLMMINSLSY